MKKNLIQSLNFLFLITAILISSCKKDQYGTERVNDNINDAKTWYEENTKHVLNSLSQSNQADQNTIPDLRMALKPDWSKAVSYLKDGAAVIEAPIYNNAKIAFSSDNKAPRLSDVDKSLIHTSFLLFNKNGAYSAYLMSIIPDSTYIQAGAYKVNSNTFKNQDEHFGGKLIYLTTKGDFISGYIYKDGKVVASMSIGSKQTLSNNATNGHLQTNLVSCETYAVSVYSYTACVTVGNSSNCTDYYTTSYITTCTDSGGGGSGFPPPTGGGGGSGGGGTPPPPPPLQNPPTPPCGGNPVANPTLAASNGNIQGARFGNTRNNGTKFHDGTDIASAPNAAIYSMYPGKVIDSRNSFAAGQYAANSYGNYVTVQSTINGQTVILKYNHLNGINATVGSTITAGTQLGVSGTTGNAAAIGVIPHVHIQASTVVNGVTTKVNPENYLATKFDSSGKPINNPCH